jgi:hypothetical protein
VAKCDTEEEAMQRLKNRLLMNEQNKQTGSALISEITCKLIVMNKNNTNVNRRNVRMIVEHRFL